MSDVDILKQLDAVLESRKSEDPESSYVAQLYHKGLNKILEKVGEEATEVVIAAKDQNSEEIVYEVADLWFHTMVLLHQAGLSSDNVVSELARRFGLSGIEEKASRANKD